MTDSENQFLTNIIRADIEKNNGAIPFSRFMELALYHPQTGYYSSNTVKFGAAGDFLTAPEISPLFAQCVANQCEQILQALPQGDFLELGAGTGQFAAVLLSTLEKKNALPNHYYILEISPDLRARQKKTISEQCPQFLPRIVWLDELPLKFSGIIFANEVLDALPFERFIIQNQQFLLRTVTYQDGNFAWGQSNVFNSEVMEQFEKIAEHCLDYQDYQSEINIPANRLLKDMANCLEQGIVLLIDYGYGRREYYHPERSNGTMQCYYRHERHEDPFIHLGLQDITAHVDFTSVAETTFDTSLKLSGYTTQAGFLLNCGLIDIPCESSDIAQTYLHNQEIRKLTLPAQMGEVIKVMALSQNLELPLLGFTQYDRRRDL